MRLKERINIRPGTNKTIQHMILHNSKQSVVHILEET